MTRRSNNKTYKVGILCVIRTMGYDDGTIRETQRGFSYDRGKLENLGIVERNGVRLVCDRMNGRLIVERAEPTLDTIRQDLETVIGDD